MKKILFKIVITFLCMHSLVVLGQGTWVLQNNPTTESGESMQFVSATEGWISLFSKQLLHTTNAGITWNLVDPNPAYSSKGIDTPGKRLCFINSSTGWVLKTLTNIDGDSMGAILYKTVNSGASWTSTVLSNNADDVGIQVQFVDENNGWILIFNMQTGVPTFLKTINGGLTWTPTNGAGIFHYVNASVGYAMFADTQGNPPYTIYKTTDGGSTWTTQYTDNTPGSLEDMYFSDVNNGWIVGDAGKILKTTNGGLNWIPVTNAGLNSNFKNGNVQFLNENFGWISTRLSGTDLVYMLNTTDGGANWTSQELPFDTKVYSMYFWDQNNGWAAAENGPIAKYQNSLNANDFNQNEALIVYPNPNNGIFTIKLGEPKANIQLEIYDVIGKQVYSNNYLNVDEFVEIDFNPPKNGVYFIKIYDGINLFNSKVIIK
jgi:photosystem II stability/assembly factor-like uncharacterized protein